MNSIQPDRSRRPARAQQYSERGAHPVLKSPSRSRSPSPAIQQKTMTIEVPVKGRYLSMDYKVTIEMTVEGLSDNEE